MTEQKNELKELKAIVRTAVDLFSLGKSIVGKQDFVTGILPGIYEIAKDVPDLVSNMGGIGAELEALKTLEGDTELVAYILAECAGVTSDEKAKAVLSAVLTAVGHVVQDVFAIKAAIEGPAPAAAALEAPAAEGAV